MSAAVRQYEVEKFARDGRGQWFGFGARRFSSLDGANEYLSRFAVSQAAVLSNGLRIDLRERAGRKLVATVGGLLDPAKCREIRAIASP